MNLLFRYCWYCATLWFGQCVQGQLVVGFVCWQVLPVIAVIRVHSAHAMLGCYGGICFATIGYIFVHDGFLAQVVPSIHALPIPVAENAATLLPTVRFLSFGSIVLLFGFCQVRLSPNVWQ